MKAPTAQTWFVLGASLATLGVLLGAIGAHSLKNLDQVLQESGGGLVPNYEQRWDTAATYQMYAAGGLMLAGLLLAKRSHWAGHLAGFALFFGTLLFSGCLYGFVITGAKPLVHVVPIGGMLFMLGFALLAWSGFVVLAEETATGPTAREKAAEALARHAAGKSAPEETPAEPS